VISDDWRPGIRMNWIKERDFVPPKCGTVCEILSPKRSERIFSPPSDQCQPVFVGNLLAALDTPAILAFCQPTCASLDAHQIAFAGTLLVLGHSCCCIASIPRTTGHRLLIQRDRARASRRSAPTCSRNQISFHKPPARGFLDRVPSLHILGPAGPRHK